MTLECDTAPLNVTGSWTGTAWGEGLGGGGLPTAQAPPGDLGCCSPGAGQCPSLLPKPGHSAFVSLCLLILARPGQAALRAHQTLPAVPVPRGVALGTILSSVPTSSSLWPLPDPETGAPSGTPPVPLAPVSCDLIIRCQPYLGRSPHSGSTVSSLTPQPLESGKVELLSPAT